MVSTVLLWSLWLGSTLSAATLKERAMDIPVSDLEARSWDKEVEIGLVRRLPQAVANTTDETSTSKSSSASSTSTSTSSSASSTPTFSASNFDWPQPFDQTLSTNFTSSTCPVFFQDFLKDKSFRKCHPLSLLLGTSMKFFQYEKTPNAALPIILDGACDESILQGCKDIMSELATTIKLSTVCGKDLAANNALAVTALQGFQSYEVVREATCKKDSSNTYCFQKAVAKDQGSSDIYFYYLPGGTTLPSNVKPSCDTCLQDLFGVYSSYATNSTLQIASTYSSARDVASLTCGPTFAPLINQEANGARRSSAESRFSTSIGLLILSSIPLFALIF